MNRLTTQVILALVACSALVAYAQQVGGMVGMAPVPDEQEVQWQTVPPGTLTAFSEGGVSFEPYQLGERPGLEKAWAKMAAGNTDWAPILPTYLGFLSNTTDESIVALTWIWSWSDPAGALHAYAIRIESLLQPGKVHPPHLSKLLMSLTPFWRDNGIESAEYSISHLRVPVTVDNTVAKFDAKEFVKYTPVSLELDTVILEDGTVLGPDKSETVELLKARKEAIDTVTKKTLELLDHQQDPTMMLNGYADKEADLSEPITFWSTRVARIYLAATNQRAIAAQLSLAPEINLHR